MSPWKCQQGVPILLACMHMCPIEDDYVGKLVDALEARAEVREDPYLGLLLPCLVYNPDEAKISPFVPNHGLSHRVVARYARAVS